MAAEAPTRFAHLLQPIRDLSKVWKIEIADELERYIEEVAELMVTHPDDGVTKLNFAEAALLIQGSTAIYSRKVELLYQLVYQALDLLALDKAKDGNQAKRAKGNLHSGLWAPIPETEELLTIDHLIKEGRNILLDHSAPEQRQAVQRRVPLFLMPRDQADRRKKEFRISSCTVHPTGVYLLQESDAKLLDDLMERDDSMHGTGMDGPLVPAPPREVQDLDDRLQEILRGLPDESSQKSAEEKEAEEKEKEKEEEKKEEEKEGEKKEDESSQKEKDVLVAKGAETPAKKALTVVEDEEEGGGDPKKALAAIVDPWAVLDEHAKLGQDTPLEVGKTSKKLNAKKLAGLESLPDFLGSSGAWLDDDALWSGDFAAGARPALSASNPVDALFLAAANGKPGGRQSEVQKAGFSAAWLEFEDLFAQASAKRRVQRMFGKGPLPPGAEAAAKEAQADGASGDEAEGAAAEGAAAVPKAAEMDCSTPAKSVVPEESQRAATPMMSTPVAMTPLAAEPTEAEQKAEEQRREVAMLESMIQDAQHKYESTIRQHLAALQKDAPDGDNKRFPQLYANVKKWEDQLAPVLKEFESRPEFDIHDYSTKFLAKLSDMYKDGDQDKVIPFPRLVHGQPRYEICRRFLTCLFLTNHGNTDIVYEGEEQRLNKFGVRLLKAEKKWISLEEEEAADAKEAEGASAAKRKAKRARTMA